MLRLNNHSLLANDRRRTYMKKQLNKADTMPLVYFNAGKEMWHNGQLWKEHVPDLVTHEELDDFLQHGRDSNHIQFLQDQVETMLAYLPSDSEPRLDSDPLNDSPWVVFDTYCKRMLAVDKLFDVENMTRSLLAIVEQMIEENVRLVMIRGLPGSGKTTFAHLLASVFDIWSQLQRDQPSNWRVLEANQYMQNKTFNPSAVASYHHCCQTQTRQFVESGTGVIVTNTFTTTNEMQPYIDIAKSYGLTSQQVLILEPPTRWKHDISKCRLLCSMDIPLHIFASYLENLRATPSVSGLVNSLYSRGD